MTRATTLILIFALALLVPCHAQAHARQLSGVWQARLQPDDAKIEQMLRRQGLAYLARLVIAPQVSSELRNSVMTLRLDEGGRFHLSQTGTKKAAGESGESGAWELLEDGASYAVLRMTSDGAGRATHMQTKRVRILHLTWQGPDRLVGDAQDWADAPFSAPTFVRRGAR